MEDIKKENIMTGIRPTGKLHIGHYFGAIKNMMEFQNDPRFKLYILVADVQALTDNFSNPEKVRDNVREIVKDLLASGIDIQKSTIYLQSMIPETAELTVFYSNLVTISRLQRNPTVKTELAQKRELFGESVTYGFLGYPVSQAADITGFNARYVPAGDDQEPLVEQTREIVRKFNSIYGDTLVEPEIRLTKQSRICGLDGNEKMGKSLGNALYLADERDVIEKKVMGALTDPNRIRKTDKGNPDVCMVSHYHKIFSSKDEIEEINKKCREGQIGCVECKKRLIENIDKKLRPIREKRKYYDEHPELIDEILINGSKEAQKVIQQTVKKVKKAMKINYIGD